MIQLLIRADDVGYSEGVNYGVEKSVKYGLIHSVGLMPNMPAAAHGVRLLEGTDTALGQHTNVCLGTPCSAAEDIPSMVDDKGQFLSSRVHRKAFSEGKDLIDLEDAV